MQYPETSCSMEERLVFALALLLLRDNPISSPETAFVLNFRVW